MVKRMVLMLAVMLTVIAALGFVKFRQVQTAMAQGASFQPPPEAVTCGPQISIGATSPQTEPRAECAAPLPVSLTGTDVSHGAPPRS
jgi:hypothetical protein